MGPTVQDLYLPRSFMWYRRVNTPRTRALMDRFGSKPSSFMTTVADAAEFISLVPPLRGNPVRLLPTSPVSKLSTYLSPVIRIPSCSVHGDVPLGLGSWCHTEISGD